MKKRILSLLLVVLLMLSVLPVHGAQEPTFEVATVTAAAGEPVSVTISVKNNPGIASIKLKVTYPDGLTLNSITYNNTIGGMSQQPQKLTSPVTLNWFNGSADSHGDWVFATLSFTVKEDASLGKADVTISYEAENIYNIAEDSVTFAIKQGGITVVCGHKNTTSVPATPADCDESGYTAGVYCNDCKTYISGHKVVPATGNHKDANGKWETDGQNHWHTCACGQILDKTAHSGGSATCTKKAVCSVCGTSYGSVNSSKHGTTELRNATPASCGSNGYTGDKHCKDCGAMTEKGRVIPATGNHVDANGKWETDGQSHWHTCACGHVFDKVSHSGGSATCTKKAVCGVCGTSYGSVNSSKHGATELRNVASASCNANGYTGDKHCKDCGAMTEKGRVIPATGNHLDANGKWETDGQNHWCTCVCGTVFDKTAHTGGKATCTEKAVCKVCAIAYGTVDADAHGETEVKNAVPATCVEDGYSGDTYCADCGELLEEGTVILATGDHVDADGKWEANEQEHFHTCGCGAEFDNAVHSGGEASCTEKAACAACGEAYGEVNAENHVNTELQNAVAATCGKPGYTGDTYCADCGEKLKDGEEIPATDAHTYGEWTVVKEATEEAEGLKEKTCTVCGDKISETIPKVEKEPEKSPETGDGSIIFLISLLAICALLAAGIVNRKKNMA